MRVSRSLGFLLLDEGVGDGFYVVLRVDEYYRGVFVYY